MKVWGFLFLIKLVLVSVPVSARADIVLNFGVYASDKPSVMVKKLRPVLNELQVLMHQHLQEKVQIRIQVAHSYEKGIAQIVKGDVDFARLGPASYVLAKQANNKLQIAAMEHNGGSKVFFGIIAVAQHSGIRQLTDLRGKSFAFGDEKSTIGRYLSQQILMEQGIMALDFKKTRYLGRHDAVAAAVASGQFDAGALKESSFNKMRNQGRGLRELVRFPNISKPWVAHGQLNPRIFRALQESLLALDNTPGLKKLRKSGFVPGKDVEFGRIREAMIKNTRFFE